MILRKPSKLTDDEFGIFKQHVALGDAIVRDVPNVELVRAGIRHHHERWDGAATSRAWRVTRSRSSVASSPSPTPSAR